MNSTGSIFPRCCSLSNPDIPFLSSQLDDCMHADEVYSWVNNGPQVRLHALLVKPNEWISYRVEHYRLAARKIETFGMVCGCEHTSVSVENFWNLGKYVYLVFALYFFSLPSSTKDFIACNRSSRVCVYACVCLKLTEIWCRTTVFFQFL